MFDHLRVLILGCRGSFYLRVLTSGCRGGCFSRPFSSASLLQSDMMQSNNRQVIILILNIIIVIFAVIVIDVARSLMVLSSTFPRLFQQKCSAHEKWIPWIDNGHIDSFYRRATDTFYSIGEQWISEYLNSTSLQSIALLYLDVPMFQWRWAQTANKRSDSHNIQWLSTQNWAVDETVITGN